jgi:hypothetical protein
MGFAGYVAVCVQLYCRGKLSLFHTTCFGLYGHLQVCRMLLPSCSWRNLLRWFFLYLARGYAFVRFHLWGGLNMRYYLLLHIIYAILPVMVYMFSCSIFSYTYTYSCILIQYNYTPNKPVLPRLSVLMHIFLIRLRKNTKICSSTYFQFLNLTLFLCWNHVNIHIFIFTTSYISLYYTWCPTMRRPDFIIFSGSKYQRCGLIIDKY